MTPIGATNEMLVRRSAMLRQLREFFYDRQFVEVETPLLAPEVIPELHIEPTTAGQKYLQASPELHMKRLVARRMPAIFQVTRSFRDDEVGKLHNPEFTIVEWYRTGDDMQAGIRLLDELCQTMLDTPAAIQTSYADAFRSHVGVCPHTASVEELSARANELDIPTAKGFRSDDRDEWLNLLLSFRVEPQLGRNAPEILFDYPATQSALARTATSADGIEVAKRFELYYHGAELANGYDELTNEDELRQRLEKVNRNRQANGRDALPMPASLLVAMQDGLPACSGCALGFDRLVMLACNAKSISEVRAFID
ncbi:MAG: EF-P lysine aminoacylase EpmA [Planctomycetota bacterium]